MREARWTAALNRGLKLLGKTREDVSKERKSAPWKVALAASLKQSTQVDNRWLSVELRMGTPVAVSAHVGRMGVSREDQDRDHGKDAEEGRQPVERPIWVVDRELHRVLLVQLSLPMSREQAP